MARTLDAHRLLLPGALATLAMIGALTAALGEAASDDLRQGDGIAELDHPVTSWLATHRTGWLITILRVITTVGSPLGVTITASLVAAVVCWQVRRVWPALVTASALGGAELLETIVKALVARPRPPLALRVHGLSAGGYSFPSGHATLAAAGYGLIAVLLVRYVHRTAARAAVWASAAMAAVAVGFSRLYLGAHWLSDVVAGWLIGAAWLGLALTSATVLIRRIHAAGAIEG